MDDQFSSGAAPQGGVARETKVRRRRSRKLSGPTAEAVGDLAFVLFSSLCEAGVPHDVRVELLKSALLRWRARYL